MPRVPIDYSKTIIYRIVCKDPTIKDCYVGSTTDFKSRKSNHKSSCNCDNRGDRVYNYNIYQFIRNNGGWDNWNMVEVEKYNAIDKLDADKRERYWLEFYQATLNKNIPSRTRKEYNETFKDEILEYQKKYDEKHRDEKLEYIKKYYEEHKDEKLEYFKKYRDENRVEINRKQQKYRDENRVEINRERREKYHQKKEHKLMGLEDKRV